jgi:hypothetical protein
VRTVSLALGVCVFATSPLLGQDSARPRPSHSFVLSGYGTAGWIDDRAASNGFFTNVNPILLFRMTDRLFAESEIEFEFDDGATNAVLEYASVHYLANDRLTITGGKFLVPFGVFAQRVHPSWINRFNSLPPLYGGHGGVAGVEPLLPVLSDIGAMVSFVAPLGAVGRSVTVAAFLTNGPEPARGHGAEADPVEPEAAALRSEEEAHGRPELAFGATGTDNNGTKMVGGRLGLVLAPTFEVDVSALWSRYGRGEETGAPLPFVGVNLAAEYRPSPRLELRSEWMWLRIDVEAIEDGVGHVETIPQVGGYVQAAYRAGPWEPVTRLALVDQRQGRGNDRLTQYGLGLNYWLSPSVALMAAVEINRDALLDGADLKNDRVLLHWAFGF